MSAIGKHAPYINSTCEIAIYFSTFEELYIHIFLTQVQLTSYHGVSIQLYLKPLTCWHCDKIHSTTEEFCKRCKRCNGWTWPTQDDCHGQVVINWEVFVMRTSDSETCRERIMKDAGMAISGNNMSQYLQSSLRTMPLVQL
jgi:hypothetical protein